MEMLFADKHWLFRDKLRNKQIAGAVYLDGQPVSSGASRG